MASRMAAGKYVVSSGLEISIPPQTETVDVDVDVATSSRGVRAFSRKSRPRTLRQAVVGCSASNLPVVALVALEEANDARCVVIPASAIVIARIVENAWDRSIDRSITAWSLNFVISQMWSTLLRWLGLVGPSRGHFHRRRLPCNEEYMDVKLDWNAPYAADDEGSLALRYFICRNPEPPRALFVYFGNEAPVRIDLDRRTLAPSHPRALARSRAPPTVSPALRASLARSQVELYVQNTGLMWESADEFNADLLFIEHRFYGKSTRPGLPLRYLSTSQALDDFAHVIEHVQRQYGRHRALPVIGFGGSYGGMLGTFFRYKYPSLVDGVIAASAPIFTYVDEDYDAYGFARTVTEDALREDPVCAETARRAWAAMLEAPPAVLAEKIRWCDASTLKRREDVRRAVDWLSEAWDMMAMGNYPYESSYLTQGAAMPAWPIRVACRLLSSEGGGGAGNGAPAVSSASSLIEAMVAAVGVYYNASGTADCYGRESISMWDYQCVDLDLEGKATTSLA